MALPKKVAILASSGSMQVDGGLFNIIDCALRNDFYGVDRALAEIDVGGDADS